MSRPSWRTRPDCAESGCEIEVAKGSDWCRDHDPDRCTAALSGKTRRSEDRRCRTRARPGKSLCTRHAREFLQREVRRMNKNEMMERAQKSDEEE